MSNVYHFTEMNKKKQEFENEEYFIKEHYNCFPGAKVRVNARVTARNMRYFARISRTFTRDHAF